MRGAGYPPVTKVSLPLDALPGKSPRTLGSISDTVSDRMRDATFDWTRPRKFLADVSLSDMRCDVLTKLNAFEFGMGEHSDIFEL